MPKNLIAKRFDDHRDKRVLRQGQNAALAGEPYGSNPYRRGSDNHLLWSRGHNDARANRAFVYERFGW